MLNLSLQGALLIADQHLQHRKALLLGLQAPLHLADQGARIETAVAVFGAEKIVCGSDGTSFGMDWTNRALDEARISEDEKNLIREGNAKRALAHSNSSLAVARGS